MSLLTGSCNPPDLAETDSEQPKAEVKSRPQSVPSPKELLRHYAAPGVPLPPSARVGDPKLKQREREPFRLTSLWRYGAFAAWKGEWAPLVTARGHCSASPQRCSRMALLMKTLHCSE